MKGRMSERGKKEKNKCVGYWKVMSANLIMRREWIKGIVWAGRGTTFHTAACHLILSPNSGLICWSSMPANNFCLSDRQWSCHLVVHHGLLYCAFCPAPTKSPDKGLNWMANLCVFHVRTCINTSFKSSQNACRLVFACILPSVSTRNCRETTVQTHTQSCVRTLPIGIYFEATCSFSLMSGIIASNPYG